MTNLVWPWYTSSWALQTMTETYTAAMDVLEAANDAAIRSLQARPLPSGQADEPGQAAWDPGQTLLVSATLQSRVAQPLGSVAVSLAEDATLWKRGVLSTPPILADLLDAMYALLDRLALMQLVLEDIHLEDMGTREVSSLSSRA